MHRSAAQYSILVLLLGIFLMREAATPPTSFVDSVFVDWVAANTARKIAPAPLTLIEINDSSTEKKHSWPWSPLDFGLFLQAVLPFNPGVIAIEQVLDWRLDPKLSIDARQKQQQYEKILHDFILRSPKMLLGAQLGYPEDPDVIPPLQEAPQLRKITGDVSQILEFTAVEHQAREDYRLSSTIGFTNLPPLEGIVRTVPMLFRYRGEIVPSFVLQAVMLWHKLTPDDIVVKLGSHITLGDKVSIPIDSRGAMRVDFKSPITRYGFDELLLAVEQAQHGQTSVFSTDLLKDRLVLLARTDSKSRTLDLPTGRAGSPGELFTAAIATVQGKNFIRRASPAFDVLVIAAMMAAAYFSGKVTRRRACFIFLLSIVLYFFVSLTIFSRYRIWLPSLLPLGLWVFVFLMRLVTPSREPAVS